jgi:type VI secretion system secreted protein Hcp
MAASTQGLVFLKIKFKNHGEQKGASKIKKMGGMDVANMIEVHEINHVISIPHDTASGFVKGRRQHSPFEFKIQLDGGSCVAQLADAACKNDTFEEAVFHFFKTNEKGDTINNYKITLRNGVITKYATCMPNVHDTRIQSNLGAFCELAISYNEIAWNSEEYKAMGEDKWGEQK